MMRRIVFIAFLLNLVVAVSLSSAMIAPEDLASFTSPCTLSVEQAGSVRTLSWDAVAGAVSYRVGYRMGTEITELAQLAGTSYEHTGWNPNDCYEYVVVAYDSSGVKVCAAHVENVGAQCPER